MGFRVQGKYIIVCINGKSSGDTTATVEKSDSPVLLQGLKVWVSGPGFKFEGFIQPLKPKPGTWACRRDRSEVPDEAGCHRC